MNEQDNVKIENEQVTATAEVTTPEIIPAAPAVETLTVETLEPVVESLDGVTFTDPQPAAVPETAPVEQTTGTLIISDVPSTEAEVAPQTEAPAPVAVPEIVPSVAEPVSEAPAPAPEPVTTPEVEPVKEEKKKEVKEKPKKEKKPFNPLLIVLLVVGLAIGVGAGFLLSGSMKKQDSGNNSNNNKPANDDTPVTTPDTYRVLFRDYLFDIPSGYNVQVNDNRLLILGSDTTYAIELKDNSYDLVNSNKDNIKSGYESKNFVVSNMDEKNVGSSNYLFFDLNNGDNIRVFFRQNNPTSIFIGVIKKIDGSATINDSDLFVIDQILSTANLSNHRSSGEENGEVGASFDDVFVVFNEVTLDENAVPATPENTENTENTENVEPTPEEKTEPVAPEAPETPEENKPVEENKTENNTTEEKPAENNATPPEENPSTPSEETTTPSEDSGASNEETTTPGEGQ